MNILAVDDEIFALEAIAKELEIMFPKACLQKEQRASKALEWAKELAEKREILSYAFLDIQIRGMNGLELAKQLKIYHPNVVLFFCTAYSEYAYDAFTLCAKGYLLKPIKAKDIEHVLDEMVTDWRFFDTKDRNVVRAKTFGNFDVFVGDTLVTFEREKSKELLAYLIDRRGSSVTTEQIAVVLWEDEPYDRKMKNRVTMIISSLRNSLRNMEIEDILVKSWNHLAIDTSRIKCDSWEYEKGDTAAINSFHGEYMVNYSWAEETTGKYTQMENKL